MDPRERWNDPIEATRVALDGLSARIWSALPGIIQSFDPVEMTCTVQPAIQGQLKLSTGAWADITLPLLIHCPVVFPSGGGFTLTFPLALGDECLVVFADRCIDAWWQQSGVQPQVEIRMHDISDGFVIPGPKSKPRALTGISTTTTQLRSDDGALYVELAGSHVMNLVAPGGLNIVAPNVHITASTKVTMTSPLMELTGEMRVDGDITGGYGGGSSVGLRTHEHSQGVDGAGDVEQNTNAPIPGT